MASCCLSKNVRSSLSAQACLIVALAFACGCSGSSNVGVEPPALQKVLVVEARQQQVTDTIELVGRTQAFEQVDIKARVSGFLLRQHFTDGQLVQQGDLLFSIEPDQFEAIYLQALAQVEVAKARLKLAEKTLARSEKLLENKAVSQEEYEQNQAALAEAQAQLTVADADVARAKLDLDYTEVTSPISGRVESARLDVGNFVAGGFTGGTVLTTVINDTPIRAVANIDENVRLKITRRRQRIAGEEGPAPQVDKLSDLQIPCYLQLPDESGFPHEGVLEYAQARVDQQTGTSQLRGLFPNEDRLLTSGMFVRLQIPVSDSAPAVLIPDRAIGNDQATKFVYVVGEGNVVEMRPIQPGQLEGQWRVVEDGVQPGDRVMVAGLQLVRAGMKVAPELQSE